jgi:diacylglycerol kinase (ATP)
VLVTVLHNPSAGESRTSKKKLIKALDDLHYEYRYQSTAEEEWEEALKEPGDLVVVAGGDGTVAKVAFQLIDRGVPMVIVPLGTANNISRAVGGGKSPFEVVREWRTARKVCLDVGVSSGPWEEVYFLESAGVGLFAQMMPYVDAVDNKEIEDEEDRLSHDRQTYLGFLEKCRSEPWRVVMDGKEYSQKLLFLEAMNLPSLGPRLKLADADPSDGLLDVVFATEENRNLLRRMLRGKSSGKERPLTTRRAKEVSIDWEGSNVHMDSHVMAQGSQLLKSIDNPSRSDHTTIHLRVKPQAVQFLAPA